MKYVYQNNSYSDCRGQIDLGADFRVAIMVATKITDWNIASYGDTKVNFHCISKIW